MKKVVGILTVLICLNSLFAESQQKFKGWKKADTQHFTFIYEKSSKETVDEYAKIADKAWNKIAEIYAIPKNHFDIYVTDRTNTVNAFTYFSPVEIGMFTTPPAINDFGFRVNWRELFFTHELIHGANVVFEDKTDYSSILFGPYSKSMDFNFVPGWALEGLTTVFETELTAGGRGRSPYFELEFKAPALENTLISYNEIGMETEPPRGQSYIMGYLIMRSIADRWGIEALADIERNRNLLVSWEDSVKLVTGCTPDEIYRDAKIALTKKYAQERLIPEGITISPRKVNTNYYKPAVVFDDGSLITVRTADGVESAVVRLDPSKRDGSNYLKYTKPHENMNTVFKETVLFEGYIPEPDCVTADENGTVYVSMGTITDHKLPGRALENEIYKWTNEGGLKKLTKKGSYTQPSVSRDGKTLVAIHQNGLTFDIVKIDVNSGKETLLVQNTKADLIQPSLNGDGSMLAFMEADGTRAKICIKNLSSKKSSVTDYDVVYNGEGDITDPSRPCWNADRLTFTDNSRGRLETYELDDDEAKSVVADPAGVLWAYKNETGIFYLTFSGTGYVIKVKPAEEWGNVPDFNGPSMPGEIMTFGKLECDFPDFMPYEKLSEVELTEQQFRDMLVEERKLPKDEPIPVHGKVVKHRSEKVLEKLYALPEPLTELSEEKNYVPLPKPFLYLPVFNVVGDSENHYFGLGAAGIFVTPKLQLASGEIFMSGVYYPKINNFDINFDIFAPLGTGTLQLMVNRILSTKDLNDDKYFSELNIFDLGYVHPLYKVDALRSKHILKIMGDFVYNIGVTDPYAFSAFSKTDYKQNIGGFIGLEYFSEQNEDGQKLAFDSTVLGIGIYSFDYDKFFTGIETDLNAKYMFTGTYLSVDADAKIRYADFPENMSVTKSLVKFNGKELSSKYPGRAVFQAGTALEAPVMGLGLRLYEETLVSYGKNTVDAVTPDSGSFMNITFHDLYATGIELVMSADGTKIATGYSFITDFKKDSFIDGTFYFTIKVDLFRD